MSEIVMLDKPGDEYLIKQVMKCRGSEDKSLPITVAEMVATFGPNWKAVSEVVRQAAVMTPEQAEQLRKARGAGSHTDVARKSAWTAAWYGGRDAATRAAQNVGQDVKRHATGNVVRDATIVIAVCDLVGQHGLIEEHVETLLGPWTSVFGNPIEVVA